MSEQAGGEGGGEGREGEGGGAAGLLNAGGGAGAGEAGGAGGAGGGGGDPWFAGLSDTAEGDAKSNRAWAETKGYKSVDAAIEALRQHEARFLAGDKLVIPKAGDPPEALEAYAKAIGRPDSAEGYEVEAPEGVALDEPLVEKLRKVAFENTVPQAAFEAMAKAFIEHGVELTDQASATTAEERDAAARALKKSWGDDFDANVAHSRRAMSMLELDMETVTGIETGIGTEKTMELLANLGRRMGEDSLLSGDGPASFKMDKAAAQAELEAMAKDGDKAKRIMDGDKQLNERRDFLQRVVASHEAAENRRAQQG